MAAGPIAERNQDATIYVGGLDEKVSDSLMWELFVQAGPVVNVHMPKDRVTQAHQGYGFVEFLAEDDADYAIKIMNMIKLYGKPIRVNKASAHQKNLDVGANVFIGNLDSEVDEKLLYDTFSAFGVILQTPKIMRDPETGNSKGFAFINYASFEASDAAIEAMNGQHLCNKAVSISYAFKKDVKGERHGSAAERLLAAQNPLSQADRPHQLFADAPPNQTPTVQQMPVPPPPIMQPSMQVPVSMMAQHQMAPPPRIMPWQNQQTPPQPPSYQQTPPQPPSYQQTPPQPPSYQQTPPQSLSYQQTPPQPPSYQPPPPPPPSYNNFVPSGFHGGFVPPPPPPPTQQGQMPPPLPPSHPGLPSHMQGHIRPPPPPPPPPPMSMGGGPPMPPPPPMQPNNMMPMNWKPNIPPPPPPAPA